MNKNVIYILIVLCSFYSANAQRTGSVRLAVSGVGDTSQFRSAGIVQVYYFGQWGNICDDTSFGYDEADVICHQLGYTGVSTYTNTGSTSLYGTDFSSTAMDDVSCLYATYLAITQCSFSTFISSLCDNNDDVIVTCYTTRIWNSPISGDIRLIGGDYSNEGVLQIYCNGQWGTVCDDSFGFTEARVACRQLGYNDYYDYEHLSLQGASSLPIWLDSLYSCSSLDSCLTSCQSCPSSENHDCTHSEDVTLECEYSSSRLKVTTRSSTYCNSTSDVSVSGVAAGVLVGSIIATIIGCIICIAIFTVPFCICCCLGVGVGAASRSRPHTTVVAQHAPTATTAVVTTTTEEKTVVQPSYPDSALGQQAPPPAYPGTGTAQQPYPGTSQPYPVGGQQPYPQQSYPQQPYPQQPYPQQPYPQQPYPQQQPYPAQY